MYILHTYICQLNLFLLIYQVLNLKKYFDEDPFQYIFGHRKPVYLTQLKYQLCFNSSATMRDAISSHESFTNILCYVVSFRFWFICFNLHK